MLLMTLLSCAAFAAATLNGPEEPLESKATIDAPVAEVWEAWTTSAGITSWMAPAGEVDFRVGGKYRTSYTKAAT
jgi:uncharacterized protein YndB with AHSA1/START domain